MKKWKGISDEVISKVIAEGGTLKNEFDFWLLTAEQRYKLETGRDASLHSLREAVLSIERDANLGGEGPEAREEFRSDNNSSDRLRLLLNNITDPDLKLKYKEAVKNYLRYRTVDSISRLTELGYYSEYRGYPYHHTRLWIPFIGFPLALLLGFMVSALVGVSVGMLTYITMVEATAMGNVELITFTTIGRIGRRIANDVASESELRARLRKIETLFL